MSSSTSSSDPAATPAGPDRWRRFVLVLVGGGVASFALVFGGIVAVDPYDTGRFALVPIAGVPFQTPRTGAASRGRDPAYDAAVVGNSHVQLLSPTNLSRMTGLSVVSLTVPSIGPQEDFALLDYWLRTRVRPPRAVVIGIDSFWCRAEPDMPIVMPFPFWLYDRNPLTYLSGLLREHALGDAFKRIGMALRLAARVRADPAGYWNYDENRVWRPEIQGERLRNARPATALNETGRFPALDALSAWLDRRPSGLAVVVLQTPVFVAALPEAETPLGRSEAACRAAVDAMASAHPLTRVVDWRTDRPETRVPENFMDETHYRSDLARKVEVDVAAALRAVLPGQEARGPPQ